MADMSNFTKEEGHEALAMAMAVALYRFNTRPEKRARLLFDHFKGACAEMSELVKMVDNPNWALGMPAPTAMVYLVHGCEEYLEEARRRVGANLFASDFLVEGKIDG